MSGDAPLRHDDGEQPAATGPATTPGDLTLAARLLAASIVVVGAADCVSTELALSTGAAKEANPIVATAQRWFGAYWVAPKMAVHVLLAGVVLTSPKPSTLAVMGAVMLLTLAATVNNVMIHQAAAAALR